MREEGWYRMLTISVIIHLVVIAAFSFPFKKAVRKFQPLSSYYSVNLVATPGGGGIPEGSKEARALPDAEDQAPPKAIVQKPERTKSKPVLAKKEPDAISLAKKRPGEKAPTPTKQELTRLEDRLREMRKKTEPLDVTKSRGAGGGTGGGLPAGGTGTGGGGTPIDPAAEKYIFEVWDKIKSAWGTPGLASFRKNLETVVTIKIRKDGRIVDINVEKRSGNRVYDESILRVLRNVDPLPPIPASLNTDSLELGFRFLPGDLS
jgi:colicin import membrane protein